MNFIKCECGDKVYLTNGFANTCYSCGTDYNVFGERLASREEWGWETGESLADMMYDPEYDIKV